MDLHTRPRFEEMELDDSAGERRPGQEAAWSGEFAPGSVAAMSKSRLLLVGILVFTVGLVVYQWKRESIVISVDDGLLQESLPLKVFETSSATKVGAWSGQSIDLRCGSKRLRISCRECFVTPCYGSNQIRFITLHSNVLTHQQLELLHSNFCVVFDAPEQIDRFASWAASDQKERVSMNKFYGSRIYNFSVHRTYDTKSPWFVSIEVAWPCKVVGSDSSSE